MMDRLLATVVELFKSSGHRTAQAIAAKLETLPPCTLPQKPAPKPPLAALQVLPSQPGAHPCVEEMMATLNDLSWQVMDTEIAPAGIKGGHAFVEIVGPDGHLKDDTLRMGIYLQKPEVFYPAHFHNAEEVYFVLSGTALWQCGEEPFAPQKPGSLIHHLANQPHAMHTQQETLLAFWGWSGDIGLESYRF